MKTKTIKETVIFPAPPEKVYELLLNSKELTVMHGAKTTMSKKPNGKFSVFDGYCHGYNIDLVENKKIEQAWHFKEEGWPEEHYSICTFTLRPVAKGTKLVLTQKGVPAHKFESLQAGWKTYYWYPLLQYLLR
jgi:activator of HSP90 ATPase